MTEIPPDRWQRLERLYHETLAKPAPERTTFLRRACGDDTGMRHEVAALIAFEADAGSFMERPALDEAATLTTLTPGAFAGRQIGDYDIVSLLGAGGMGEVYLARDRRLGRDVALKLLHAAATADAYDLRRFEDEARSASILTHPNIVTIYGVGEEDGVTFIAMERVQGRTLREYAAGAPLPVDQWLDLAIQLGDALTHAHLNGIVHRDLKPDNIMVTPEGLVKVLDFGIAKREVVGERPLVSADGELTSSGTLRGALFGTVGYMSPEQIAGEPARPASDQFSLGVMLYEMATGQRAFARKTPQTTLDAILHEDPTPIRTLAPDVPPALRQIIERCLAKQPDARFAATRDLADELRHVRSDLEHAAQMRALRRVIGKVAAAAIVIAAVGMLIAWRLWWRPLPLIASQTLAVLPFSVTPGNDDRSYAGEGTAEALTQRFRGLSHLNVTPSEVALSFAKSIALDVAPGQPLPPNVRNEIRSLKVQKVLIGSVVTTNEQLRIEAALVDVASGNTGPSERWTVNRPLRDIANVPDGFGAALVDIQREVAQKVVGALGLDVSTEDHRLERPTQDDVAYNLLLKGNYLVRHNKSPEALPFFEGAIARDDKFAAARVARATAYTMMLLDGLLRPAEGWRIVNTELDRALFIDPSLPLAHAGLAWRMFLFDRNWDGAKREFEFALNAGGHIEGARVGYAFEQWATGRTASALDLVQHERKVNPFQHDLKTLEGDYQLQLGRLEEAAVLYEEASEDNPERSGPLFGLAEVQKRQANFDDAIVTLRRAYALEGKAGRIRGLATARGKTGLLGIEREAALLDVQDYERAAKNSYVSPYLLAGAYARAGNKARALDLLESAQKEGSPGLVFLGVSQAWDSLRHEPRFQQLLERVGLANQPSEPK